MNIGLRQYENTAMVDVYLDSKGGGVTHLGIGFLPEAFDELIETMMAVDREAVITAFSRASLKYRRKAKRFAKSASS